MRRRRSPRAVRAITALVEAVLVAACAASSAPNSPNGGGASSDGAPNTSGASTSSGTGSTASGNTTSGPTSGGSSSGNGSAGTASSSAGGSSDGSSAEGGVGSGTGFFTDGFESDAVGSQPAGFGTLIDYIANGSDPNSSGDLALVDTTHVHSGAHAVHFHVAAVNNMPSFLTYTLPTGTSTLYVRAWVYLSQQLGDNTASQNDNHETLFALNGSPGNVNNEIRFGAIKGTIGVNATPSDNITPLQASWNGPPSIPATTWTCLEVAFLGAPAQNELHAWMNDADLFDVTTPTQWQNGTMPMNWLSGEFVEIDLGWQSFSGFGADVWMDDLILGNDRIGCD
ncbi:MAG TPA: hypothetical protein VEK07_01915 [Polyangiaceae bacterium]|nr:hypothetical protein [Polyangiaceae bacterium]